MKPFFHRNPKLFGIGQTIWADKLWGIFDPFISAHFLIIHYFYKKLSPYIQIPNILLGFEFGPQRIRDLASVVRGFGHVIFVEG